MSLNAQSPIPLYRQLADRIRSDIALGHYAEAARIPSEHDMAERYHIGRPTVRQATDMLVQQGLLERRRGSGTYVLPPPRSIDLFSLAGTSAAFRKSDIDSELVLVAGPVGDAGPAELNADSDLEAGVKPRAEYLKIERRASVVGAPVLYETLWFDADLFSALSSMSLENQSLSELVRDEFFLEPTSADQTFYVELANEIQAQQLEVEVGMPLLRVHRELHFGQYQSALIAQIVCRTDRFEFSQTLFPARATAARCNEQG